MTQADKPPRETLRVTCPTCHERLEVDLAPQSQVVKCSFCEARVSVPSREQAEQELQAQRPLPAPVVEGYAVSGATGAPATPGRHKTSVGKSGKGTTGRSNPPPSVAVVCPTCHERMHAPVAERAAKIACTYCGAAVRVPARDELKQWKEKPVAPQHKKELGEYKTGPVHAPPPLRMHLFDRMAEIRREAPVPPPRWTFFSGVFSFPWRSETISRWGGMTFGLTVVSLISTFMLGGGAGAGPQGMGVIGMGFFALPLIWITLFTMSFSADCCLCILESTAYGLDHIESWPDGGWKDWMAKLLYLGWIASTAIVASYGAGCLAELGGVMFWPVMLGTLFVLFPIVLLSAMEANSIWVPLTIPILKSLFLLWWGWFVFYLLTGLMALGLGALLHFGLPRHEYETMIAFAALLAAAILIYARLVGRLAWKISQRLSADE